MAKIYVASSWRNSFQPDVVKFLRDRGHEVYDFRNPPGRAGFGWENIDPNWRFWDIDKYKEHLEHPLAIEGFNADFDGMKWADICILVLPCGRSAHSEAGWMKGAGKKVFVYYPTIEEPELMYKLYNGISGSMMRICDMIN